MPRSALSRATRARSGQLSIFDEIIGKQDEVTPVSNGLIFGMILYSSSADDPEIPGFVDLVIPDGDCQRPIMRRDLIKMAADLRVAESQPVQTRDLRLKAPARSEEAQ